VKGAPFEVRVWKAVCARRVYMLFSVAIYAVGIVAGSLIRIVPEIPINVTRLGTLEVFMNNVKVGIYLFLLGNVTFGIGNTGLLAFNGLVLGVSIRNVWHQYGLKPLVSGVLPHAPVEIAATLICNTLGYETVRVLRRIGRTSGMDGEPLIRLSEIVFLWVVAIVLFGIGAVIEGKISAALVSEGVG